MIKSIVLFLCATIDSETKVRCCYATTISERSKKWFDHQFDFVGGDCEQILETVWIEVDEAILVEVVAAASMIFMDQDPSYHHDGSSIIEATRQHRKKTKDGVTPWAEVK